jgi:hypothetical protein
MKTRYAMLFLAASLISGRAEAWGPAEHRVIAEIAERSLQPAQAKYFQKLLDTEKPGESLVDIANWADEVRPEHLPGAPMHSVRLRLGSSSYSPQRDCPRNACVLTAIQRYYGQLNNPTTSNDDRVTALKYVVHLVGDVHQPFHDVEGAGSQVVLYGRNVEKLHKVWDTLMPNRLDLRGLASQRCTAVSMSTPIIWALRGRDIAERVVLPDLAKRPQQNGMAVVDPANYARTMGQIASNQLHDAGCRLATMLNNVPVSRLEALERRSTGK